MTKIFLLALFLFAEIIQPTFSQEMYGGVDAISIEGNIQGTATPTTNLVSIDGYSVEDQIAPGDNVDVSALLLSNDDQLGFVGAYRSSTLQSVPTGGYASSYKLAPWEWKKTTPMQLYVYTYGLPYGITSTNFGTSVRSAANTWDQQFYSAKGIFSDQVLTTTTRPVYNDGRFVQSFTSSYSSWLAMNRLIYYSPSYNPDRTIKTEGELKDADVQYNKRYRWSTASPTPSGYIDLQTVVLHELGHNVGLLDLYNDPNFSWDTEQTMNSYRRQQRWLGLGDKAGLKAQYPGRALT